MTEIRTYPMDGNDMPVGLYPFDNLKAPALIPVLPEWLLSVFEVSHEQCVDQFYVNIPGAGVPILLITQRILFWGLNEKPHLTDGAHVGYRYVIKDDDFYRLSTALLGWYKDYLEAADDHWAALFVTGAVN